jgi:hypothetical protein
MADRPRTERGDEVTMAPGASPGKTLVWLAAAVGLACLALLVLFGRPERAPQARPPEASAPAGASAREESAQEETEAEPRTASPRPAPPPVPPSEAAAPEPAAEPAAGAEDAPPPTVPSGIFLFPPPGTDPVKIGLVVPDDFELPEGYLRHYQVTDDGQELPPILLFHPDYELLGPDGEPLPLPADRVVPPELAPPGMPQERLVLPEPREEEGR